MSEDTGACADCCGEARAEVEAIRADRGAWAAASREQFDRIGVALDPLRRKRATGEPARDDATEIEEICAKIGLLKDEIKRLTRREVSFAEMLRVADGGRYVNDWTASIQRVVRERNEARAEVERLHGALADCVLAYEVACSRDDSGHPEDPRIATARALLDKEADDEAR